MSKTNNDRIQGWRAVKEMLNPHGKSGSKLRIFSNCKNLIRCIPLLQHDEKKVEDIAINPHEITHAPDALRGFCVYRFDGGQAPYETARPMFYEFTKPNEENEAAAYGYGERMVAI